MTKELQLKAPNRAERAKVMREILEAQRHRRPLVPTRPSEPQLKQFMERFIKHAAA